jgi:Domain of unknown function (DUF4270)
VTIRPIRFILFCFSFLLLISSCKKLNEATDLGDDVIPGVDGVNTFDTTLNDLQTFNSIFDPLKDSIRVGRNNDQIIGNILNDPLFGKTNAKLFVELKPEFYPWNFSGVYKRDSLYIDSVVMVLGWNDTYGDTMAPQRVRVWEMDQSNDFRIDTFLTMRDPGFTYSNQLGSKDFYPAQLKDSVKAFQDTTAGQLRIKLNNSFGRRLLDYDTTNAYATDSGFKTYFKGFAIDADQSFGNAIMAFGIYNNPKSKLAIYYRYTKGGQDDTTVSYFLFTNSSAIHNYIKRDFSPAMTSTSNDNIEDNPIYIINTPGSYATIKAPGLKNLSNRIINRAELIVEEVYDVSDRTFVPPDGLMLDVYDSTLGDYKFVPYDFIPDQNTGFANASFGMYGQNTVDGSGNPIKVWKFNITRYVQNIITKQEPLHDFRLFTTKGATERLKQGISTNQGAYQFSIVNVNSQFAFGRVRVGGGKHPTQRMRLRIIYTKI